MASFSAQAAREAAFASSCGPVPLAQIKLLRSVQGSRWNDVARDQQAGSQNEATIFEERLGRWVAFCEADATGRRDGHCET